MWFVTSRTLSVIGRIFQPAERKQISSVVGGSQALNQAIGFNAHEGIFVLAVISLSLGLINLFPFLPLDGGHIFWSLVEKLRGEPVSLRVMEGVSVVGFALVAVLFFIGLSNDIGRLGGWEENLVTGTVRWTDSAFGLFGLTPRPGAEIPLADLHSYVMAADKPVVKRFRQRLPEQRDALTATFRVVHPDDRSIRQIRVFAEPVTEPLPEPDSEPVAACRITVRPAPTM